MTNVQRTLPRPSKVFLNTTCAKSVLVVPFAPSAQRGFTLVEILVVVLILGISAAIVVPMAMNTSHVQAVSAARIVAADVQYAQNEAITNQDPITITFDKAAKSYTLSNASGILIHPITKVPYVTVLDAAHGMGQVSLSSAFDSQGGVVVFDALGAPDNGGAVTLRAGPHTLGVNVAAATGRITVTGG